MNGGSESTGDSSPPNSASQLHQKSNLNSEGPLRTIAFEPPFKNSIRSSSNVFSAGEHTNPVGQLLPPNREMQVQLNTPLGPAPALRSDPLLSNSTPPLPPAPEEAPAALPTSSDPLSHLLSDPPASAPPQMVTPAENAEQNVENSIPTSHSYPSFGSPGDEHRTKSFSQTFILPASPLSSPRSIHKMVQSPRSVQSQQRILNDYVNEFMAGSSAILPSLEQISPSPKALRKLGRLRAWKKVTEVAAQLLGEHASCQQSLTPEEQMEVKLAHMWGLYRLKRMGELQAECQAMGLHPRTTGSAKKPIGPRAQFIAGMEDSEVLGAPGNTLEEPFIARPTPWVPMALRLIAAEAFPTSGRVNQRADALYCLLSDLESCRKTLESEPGVEIGSTSQVGGLWCISSAQEAQAWQRRVRLSLINLFLYQHSFRLALGQLEEILQELAPSLPGEPQDSPSTAIKDRAPPAELHRCRMEIYSRMGKIFLQMGNLQDAKLNFQKAEEEDIQRANIDSGHTTKSSQIHLNHGLIALAQNEFAAAMTEFDAVIKLERIRQSEQEFSFDAVQNILCLGLEPDERLLVAAVNNYAVCALYTCNLKGAIKYLEDIIREDPVRNMWDAIVFNLSTLYDLDSDNLVSQRKKHVLEQVALRFHLDDIDPQSFRINS